MKIKELKSKLNLCPQIPKLLIGPPGVGKTEIVRQWAQEIGRKCYTVPLAHFRPEDLFGIPYVVNGDLKICRPPNLPGPEEKAVVFFDEITTVQPDVVAIALKAVDEKLIGFNEYKNSLVVAAGNPPEWGGLTLDERLISRFAVFHIEPDVDSLIAYFNTKYGSTIGFAYVSSFLVRNPQFVLKRGKEGQVFPTPRAWEKALQILNEVSLSDDSVVEDLGSVVSEEVAVVLVKFCKLVDVLSITDAVLNGEEVRFSTDKLDIAYLITTSLATRTENEKQAKACLKFIQTQLLKNEIPKDLIIHYLRLLNPKKLHLEKIANFVPDEIWLNIGRLLKE